jgi:hypothetical protein
MYMVYAFIKIMVHKYRFRKCIKYMNIKNRVIMELKSLPTGTVISSFRGGDDYLKAMMNFNESI